jgi:aspartate/methionine/tyrosine aminotransferase
MYLNNIVSAGSYTNPIGILSVRKTIAKRMREQNNIDSITADDILLIEGITQSIHMIFKSLITSSDDSILVPVPSYNMFS